MKFILVTLFLMGILEARGRPLTITVLPFENRSGEKEAWLSVAMSDAIATKISASDEIILIEREHLDSVIRSSSWRDRKDDEIPGLLGADLVVIGSYTVLGDQLRLFGRIVKSKQASVVTGTPISVHGSMNEIFDLQTELAEEINLRLGLKLDKGQLSLKTGETFESQRLFSLGRTAYFRKLYKEALEHFLRAQQINGGYFAQAHYYEGKARSALASSASDEVESKRQQKEHLKKFENDASEAAAAFFNLGLAYENNDLLEKAISCYDKYLQWLAEEKKSILWKHRWNNYSDHSFYPTRGAADQEFLDGRTHVMRYVWQSGERMFAFRQQELVCHEVETGKELWAITLPNAGSWSLCVGKKVILLVDKKGMILKLDPKSGELIDRVAWPIPADRQQGYDQISLSDDESSAVLLSVSFPKRRKVDPRSISLFYWNLAEKELTLLGERKEKSHRKVTLSRFGNAVRISWENGWKELDLKTGEMKTVDGDWPDPKQKLVKELGFGNMGGTFYNRSFGRYFAQVIWKKGMTSNRLGIFDLDSKRFLFDLPVKTFFKGYRNGALYFDSGRAVEKYSPEGELLFRHEMPRDDRYRVSGFNSRGILLKGNYNLICINEKSLELPSFEGKAHFRKGVCLKKLRRYGQALSSFDGAILISPYMRDAHYEKAEIKRILSEEELRKNPRKSSDKVVQLRYETIEHYDEYLELPGLVGKKDVRARKYLLEHGGIEHRLTLGGGKVVTNGENFFHITTNSQYGKNGDLKWMKDIRSPHVYFSGNTCLQLMVSSSEVVVSDIDSGEIRNKVPTSGSFLRRPVLHDSAVRRDHTVLSPGQYGLLANREYVFFYENRKGPLVITAFHQKDPSRNWKVSVGSDTKNSYAAAEVVDELMYIYVNRWGNTGENYFACVDLASKEVLWERDIPFSLGGDVENYLIEAGKIFYCGSNSKEILVMDRMTGETVKSIPIQHNIGIPMLISPLSMVQFTTYSILCNCHKLADCPDFNSSGSHSSTNYVALDIETLEKVPPIDGLNWSAKWVYGSEDELLVLNSPETVIQIKKDNPQKILYRTFRNREQKSLSWLEGRYYLSRKGQRTRVYGIRPGDLPDIWFKPRIKSFQYSSSVK